jgi:hypothetical protein
LVIEALNIIDSDVVIVPDALYRRDIVVQLSFCPNNPWWFLIHRHLSDIRIFLDYFFSFIAIALFSDHQLTLSVVARIFPKGPIIAGTGTLGFEIYSIGPPFLAEQTSHVGFLGIIKEHWIFFLGIAVGVETKICSLTIQTKGYYPPEPIGRRAQTFRDTGMASTLFTGT